MNTSKINAKITITCLFFFCPMNRLQYKKNAKAEVEPLRKRNGGQKMLEPSIFYSRIQ